MRISCNWLKEILKRDLDLTPEQLSEKLLHLGFEVSAIQHFSGCSGIVVSEILEITKHPQADRLRIAQVSDGKETLKVVCGAPNIAVGQKVFWAKTGSVLADGTRVKEVSIRGVKSPGMLCSAKELGVGEDHAGLWILSRDTKVGAALEEEVQLEDCWLDVEVTPNRPDCLSHVGMAREIAAALNLAGGKALPSDGSLREKPESSLAPELNPLALPVVPVAVEDPSDCPRYIAKKIEGGSVASSPLTVQTRLIRSGIRPINNIVDITNYVMLETGQPLHTFDADKLEGGKIIVRRANTGEKILALDGKTYFLDPEILVIADAAKPAAIAGIMGGEETSVTHLTRNILLESAVFDSRVVRHGRKKLGLGSESSYRFERGVSRWSCSYGSDRAETMMHQHGIGKTSGFSDTVSAATLAERSTSILVSQIEKNLGNKISVDQIASVFQRLDIPVLSCDDERCVVQSPAWRLDLTSAVDYIEEIARLVGYEKIDSAGTQIQLVPSAAESDTYRLRKKIKSAFKSLGFYESCNYGLISKKSCTFLFPEAALIELENPLSEDQSVLRPTLIVELFKNMNQNLAYQKKEMRFFEIGAIFQKMNDQFVEKTFLAGAACGKSLQPTWQIQEPLSIDFYWVKGAVEQLMADCSFPHFQFIPFDRSTGGAADALSSFRTESSAEMQSIRFPALSVLLHPHYSYEMRLSENAAGDDGENGKIGYVGLIHPKTAKTHDLSGNTVLFELDLTLIEKKYRPHYELMPIRRNPAIKRDCSILVKADIAWGALESEIKKSGGELLEECQLFDLYALQEESLSATPLPGKEKREFKSLSFTLTFRHPEKTLDDPTANKLRDKIVDHLRKKFQAELRKKE